MDTDALGVVGPLTRQVKTLPHELMGSLTWGSGMEVASHTNFTVRVTSTPSR